MSEDPKPEPKPRPLMELAEDLSEQYKDAVFEPNAFYSDIGDMLEVYWEPSEYHVEHLTGGISLHRSLETGAVIGVTIEKVRHR